MIENLQYVSILIESIIVIIGLLIVFNKKKKYGIGIFITFAVYVFYDSARLLKYSISENILYIIFFIATLSALYFVLSIYKETKNKTQTRIRNKIKTKIKKKR